MTHPLGPFVLQSRLAAGGMGEVWAGRHVAQDVPVAIKVITGDAARDPAWYRAFRREVQAAAALDHPGIVTLFDYGSLPEDVTAIDLVPGSPYLVMERAAGALNVCPTSWPELREILLTILDALAHAHARGIVHRDLKPGNVLRFGAGSTTELKLADFGIARSLDASRRSEEVDVAGSVVGTPHYMPPEQWSGEWRDHGPWTDLYAVGVIAWELATGSPPWEGPALQIMYGHLQAPLPAFEPLFPTPPGFRTWLVWALEKAWWRRFQTARQAALALPPAGVVLPKHDASSAGLTAMPTLAERASKTMQRAPQTVREALPAPAPVQATIRESLTPGGLGVRATVREAEPIRSTLPLSPGDSYEPLPKAWDVPASWESQTPDTRSMRLVGVGLGLFGLRQIPVVDRDEPRSVLWEQLASLAERPGTCATVLRGAAGVGKSRLAQWYCEQVSAAAGLRILRAEHQRSGGMADGLVRMVNDHYRLRGLKRGDAVARIRERVLREPGGTESAVNDLVTFLGLHRGAADAASSARIMGPAERHATVLAWLNRISAGAPVIVWIDDAQWGYDALAFAAFALEHAMPELRLQFVITARDEDLRERYLEADLIERLARGPHARTAELGALQHDDVAELVERMLFLSRDVARSVVERVGGNPLFAVQLVADWVQRGVLTVGTDGFQVDASNAAVVPDDLHAMWRDRLDAVLRDATPEQENALRVAATLGRAVEARELASALATFGVQLSERVVETMVMHRLATRTDDGWSFSHGLLQESLLRSAREDGTLPRCHAACARALESLYPRHARGVAHRIAWHHLGAHAWESAVVPLIRAIEERTGAADYAFALALCDDLERSLRSIPAGSDDVRWGRLSNLRAHALRLHWRFDEAREEVETTMTAAETHGWVRELAVARAIAAHLCRQAGDLERARSLNQAALDGFRVLGDGAGEASATLAMAIISRQLGDFGSAESMYRAAQERFAELSDAESVGKCLAGLGNVYRSQRRGAEASALYEQARAIFERIGARHELANAINNIAEIQRYAGRLGEAEANYREAIAIHRAIGSNAHIVPQLNLGVVLRSRGDFAGARKEFERGADELEATGQRSFLAWAHANLLSCLVPLRDLEAFDEHARLAAELIDETSMIDPDMAEAAWDAADGLRSMGDRSRARVALEIAQKQWESLADEAGLARAAELEAALG